MPWSTLLSLYAVIYMSRVMEKMDAIFWFFIFFIAAGICKYFGV